MILWAFALFLLSVLALIGYYQGAVRVAFSLVGLLLAAALAMPLAFVFKPILPVFGIKHPVLLAFLAPVVAYLLILILFKSAALAVHKKVDTHFKYQESDTKRLLWERFSQRAGLCLGLANGTVYVLLLALVAYVVGYFTVQVATTDQDPLMLRAVNRINRDMKNTGLDKAVAPFSPASEFYYDAADILGLIYHNPLLQNRLSSYPPFLTLAEKPEFEALGKDTAFQNAWLGQARVGELQNHERIKPLVQSPAFYREVTGLVGGDLKDLKGYLENGHSAKFDHEKILGRWSFDFQGSMDRARRAKPNMGSAELRRVRTVLRTSMSNAIITATVDNQIRLKTPSGPDSVQVVHGTWKETGAGAYSLTFIENGKTFETEAVVDSTALSFMKEGIPHVFAK